VKTILLVDSDLGFAFWLGHSLDQAGYDALPARSVADAMALLEELNVTVDLLVINASLPSADTFIASLRERSKSHLKVIAVFDNEADMRSFAGSDAELHKPHPSDEAARMECINTIRSAVPENSIHVH
jgi:DNA-binding response OmpR family regulator